MKSKYIFIHSAGPISTETVFYTVYFGTSKEDAALLQRCQFLQHSTDFYFKPYSAAVADFLYNIAVSLFPGCTLPMLRLQTQRLDARAFVAMLRNNIFTSAVTTSNLSHMLCALDSSYYSNHSQLWKRQ